MNPARHLCWQSPHMHVPCHGTKASSEIMFELLVSMMLVWFSGLRASAGCQTHFCARKLSKLWLLLCKEVVLLQSPTSSGRQTASQKLKWQLHCWHYHSFRRPWPPWPMAPHSRSSLRPTQTPRIAFTFFRGAVSRALSMAKNGATDVEVDYPPATIHLGPWAADDFP